MRPITAATLAGTALPIVLLGVAAIYDLPRLAIAALVVATVSPSIGHVIYRRTLGTRGFFVRLIGGAVAGILVLAARRPSGLDAALRAAIAFLVIALAAFIVGAVLDAIDGERA